MSAHCGVGTELGEVQQGPIGTDAVGDRLGQLDHWGPLVLALGDIQDGGTSLPDRSVGDAPPSGPPQRALGLRRGSRGLRLVGSGVRAAARKRTNDVWLVTNVLDPKRLPAELAARFYRMRWES